VFLFSIQNNHNHNHNHKYNHNHNPNQVPAAAESVLNFTAFYETAANPADGVSFNLYNNNYWTNYVLWYPWRKEDDVARFRFKLSTTTATH
jgi:hypothetical protein